MYISFFCLGDTGVVFEVYRCGDTGVVFEVYRCEDTGVEFEVYRVGILWNTGLVFSGTQGWYSLEYRDQFWAQFWGWGNFHLNKWQPNYITEHDGAKHTNY